MPITRPASPRGRSAGAPRSAAPDRADRLDDTRHALKLADIAARPASVRQRKAAHALDRLLDAGRLASVAELFDFLAEAEIDEPRWQAALQLHLQLHARRTAAEAGAPMLLEPFLQALQSPTSGQATALPPALLQRAVDVLKGTRGIARLPADLLAAIVDEAVQSADAPSSHKRHLAAELLATFEAACGGPRRQALRETRIATGVAQAALLRPHTTESMAEIARRLEPLRHTPALAHALEALLRDALPHAQPDVAAWVAAGAPPSRQALEIELGVAVVLLVFQVLTRAGAIGRDNDDAQRLRTAALTAAPIVATLAAWAGGRRPGAAVNERAIHAFGLRETVLGAPTTQPQVEAATHVPREVDRERRGMLAVVLSFLADVPDAHLAGPLAALCDLPSSAGSRALLSAELLPRLPRLDAATLPAVLHAALRNRALAPGDATQVLAQIDRCPPASTAAVIASATPHLAHLARLDRADALRRVRAWAAEDGLLRRLPVDDLELAVVPLGRLLHDLGASPADKALLAEAAYPAQSHQLLQPALNPPPSDRQPAPGSVLQVDPGSQLAKRLHVRLEHATSADEIVQMLTLAEVLFHRASEADRQRGLGSALSTAAGFIHKTERPAGDRLAVALHTLRGATRCGVGLTEPVGATSVFDDLMHPDAAADFSETQYRSLFDGLLNTAASFQTWRPGRWIESLARAVRERYVTRAMDDPLRDANLLHIDHVLRRPSARFPAVEWRYGDLPRHALTALDAAWNRQVDNARRRQASARGD